MRRFWANSRGEMEILIILVVIIGAFMLSGGQFLLDKQDGVSGGGGTNRGTPGGPNPSDNNWKIELANGKGTCDSTNHALQVEITFHGTVSGFFRIDIKNGDAYQPVLINDAGNPHVYNAFTPNATSAQGNSLTLSNNDGFNTKPWRVVLFQGGTVSGNDLTGGTQKAEKDFSPTGCQ